MANSGRPGGAGGHGSNIRVMAVAVAVMAKQSQMLDTNGPFQLSQVQKGRAALTYYIYL